MIEIINNCIDSSNILICISRPRRFGKSYAALPAMIVELKWNETADSTIQQIKEKRYPAILEGYVGEMVLVGINYDEKSKKHSCKIEMIEI